MTTLNSELACTAAAYSVTVSRSLTGFHAQSVSFRQSSSEYSLFIADRPRYPVKSEGLCSDTLLWYPLYLYFQQQQQSISS